MENLIPLFVIASLGSAFLISLLGRKISWITKILSFISSSFLVFLSVVSIWVINSKEMIVYKIGGWKPPIGICMVLDGLSAYMLLIVNIISFLVIIYSYNYIKKYTASYKYYTLFYLMLAGMNGVILTGDLFNMFVYLEVAAVSSYALVAFGTGKEELEASFKYMVMGTVASAFILLGIAITYSYTSTLNLADIGRIVSQNNNSILLVFVSVIFIMGFGLKAALVPIHWWLPDAHPSAPAPISAMLSGVLIKALGIYAIIRLFYNVFGLSPTFKTLFMMLGLLSMAVGALLAMGQNDIKRLLAYSSISQIGFIIFGFSINTYLGITGALLHVFNHAFFKSLLFLNSGAIEYRTHSRNLDEIGGIFKKMPLTGATSFIASMSLSGIPPFAGFWSKIIIIIAAVQAEHYIGALIAAILSIITIGYVLKIQSITFKETLVKSFESIKEVPFGMKFAMIVLSIVSLFGGLMLIPSISDLILDNASNAVILGKEYINLVLGSV